MDIVENEKAFLDDFVRLNEEWITTYFELEDVDRALARNPYWIVESGGYIFSLILEGEVCGVCALFSEGGGVYELGRMAVTPARQGKGLGGKLMLASLTKLENIGARKVYLVSNTKLEAAISLYQKYGFHTVMEGPHPVYARANIVMERAVCHSR